MFSHKNVMKKLISKICNGYLGLLFPLIVSIILLEKLHHLLLPVTHWVESQLHITRLLGMLGILLISILLMLLLGYLAGWLLGSSFVKRQVERYENGILSKIPMYNLLKSLLGTQTGLREDDNFRPGLLQEEEALTLCYVTSESEHYYTICLANGGLNGGDVRIVLKGKVSLLDMSLPEFTRLVKQYGIHSAMLAEHRLKKE